MTVACMLYVAAFVTAVVHAAGYCPLWVSVLLLCVAGLLSCFH